MGNPENSIAVEVLQNALESGVEFDQAATKAQEDVVEGATNYLKEQAGQTGNARVHIPSEESVHKALDDPKTLEKLTQQKNEPYHARYEEQSREIDRQNL